MSILLCIDGGGTYTRMMVLNNREPIYENIIKQGSNYKKNKDAFKCLDICISKMLNEIRCSKIDLDKDKVIIAGIAGIDTDEEFELYKIYFEKYDMKVFLYNDAVLALNCIFGNEDGMVVVAGTGSNIVSRVKGQIIQNYNLEIDTEAGSRYILRNYLNQYILEEESTENYFKGFGDLQVKLIQELSRKFKEIDFETYYESNDLAKYISQASENGNVIAYDAINHALKNLCFAIKRHLMHHGIDSIELVLYGGLFSSEQAIKMLKVLILKELPNYNIEINKYKDNILNNSWRIIAGV